MHIVDTAPVDRWNIDVMELDGRDKFLRVVEEVLRMFKAINCEEEVN